MERVIHVLDGYSAQGTLKVALKREGINEKTVGFPQALFYGDVPTKDSYGTCVDRTYCFFSTKKKVRRKEELSRFFSINFSDYDKVVVWHSNDSQSQFVLYMMANLIAADRLYEVDLREAIPAEEFMRRSNPIDHTLHPACCTEDDFIEALKFVSIIDDEKVKRLQVQWRHLVESSCKSPWRFLKDGEIITLEEGWMDVPILEQLSLNPAKHTLYFDIGQIMVTKLDQVIGDYPIFARIKEMAPVWGYRVTNKYIEKIV